MSPATSSPAPHNSCPAVSSDRYALVVSRVPTVVRLAVAGRGGVPTGRKWAVLNVMVLISDDGFVTVYP